MRVPQVNDRVKEAPAVVLRAVFAGIGQLMSTADKIRNSPAWGQAPAAPEPAAREPAAPETTAPRTPETVRPEPVAAETAPSESAAPEPVRAQMPSVASVADEPVVAETAVPETAVPETAVPGTVAPSPAVPKMVPPESAVPEVKPEAPEPVTPAVKPEAPVSSGGHVRLLPPDEVPTAAAPAGDLPVPNYDDLSVASLRARLRNLSADQISQLIDYEKSHAGRADVITMFERRITKLAEG